MSKPEKQSKQIQLVPVQRVLELACAAQRYNNGYIKEVEITTSEDGKDMYTKSPNKILILRSLSGDPLAPLVVTADDTAQAEEIKKYYRKLMFAAVTGDNEFHTEINIYLTTEFVPINKIGYIACLPATQKRDIVDTRIKKLARDLSEGYAGDIGSQLLDKDCEILESIRSKNFDAWNITAIIENKMVSWMSKFALNLGPCVVIKAKVKDHNTHWKNANPVTRLHYVKAAQ